MEHVGNMKRLRMWATGLVCVCAAGLAIGCDNTDALERDTDLAQLSPDKLVKEVTISPVFDGKSDEPVEYMLNVRMRDDLVGIRLPDQINLLGYAGSRESVFVSDNGKDGDERKGDGNFTARVAESCTDIPPSALAQAAKGPEFEFKFSCDLSLVPPGESCGQWGTCPERVERSFLWGLIEYETDVFVCWCVSECSPEIGFSS